MVNTVYCPYDPEVTIDGEKLKFIVSTAVDPTSIQFAHFKELGRFISVDLKEEKMKTEIRHRFEKDFELVITLVSMVYVNCSCSSTSSSDVSRGCSLCMTSLSRSRKSWRTKVSFV